MRAECASLTGVRFEPLPASMLEADEIARIWNDARASRADTPPDATPLPVPSASSSAEILSRNRASERAFKERAPGHRVLHLATHGSFLGGPCRPAAEGTRGVGGLAKSAPAPVVDNPLLLSGLALAGVNHRARATLDEDDGMLTAEEVTALNLDSVEWAVLSACDTGVGEVKAGEGVFGLRRAFQIAGARTVIMSLWSVEDRSAMTWMRALYEGRLRRRLDTADAVRHASLTVVAQRRARGESVHPFFWAAFVATGDWR
jgi:CHAT domain-containing protein